MYAMSQRGIFRLAPLSGLIGLLGFLVCLIFPAVLAGGLRARDRGSPVPDVTNKPSPQHYILTKLVMFNPTPGEEGKLDSNFIDMAGPELSSRIEIRATNENWAVKECGSIKSCEVLWIEISADPGAIHYIAKSKLINPAPSDNHPGLKLTADCPILPGETEGELLNDCHIPQFRQFARDLTSHDQSMHGGNP